MQIGLLLEGTYPLNKGGVSTWCDHLIGGLPQFNFDVVTLIGSDERVGVELPHNVTSVTLPPMWGPVPRPGLQELRHRHALKSLLDDLWMAALPPAGGELELAGFTAALRTLTSWQGPRLRGMLARHGSTQAVLNAWQQHAAGRDDLPEMTLSDAAAVARLSDPLLAIADHQWPRVDVAHVASNGAPSLLALGQHWRLGTPILLTEHGIYLRERYIALKAAEADLQLSWVARSAVMALLRGITQVTYQEAARITPVSNFNARWEETLGADAERIETVYNGVDTKKYTPIVSTPSVPTVSFIGRIDPLKDIATLISAFAVVREQIPAAKLRLFGPVPAGNEAYQASLEEHVARLELADAVSFEGGVPSAHPAFEAGQVVAQASISEGLPFAVIEAMMSGRPTVSTDVGGVPEIVGDDGQAGRLAPPRNPQAFAAQLIEVLSMSPRERVQMGAHARRRAERLFSLDGFTKRYAELYTELGSSVSPATQKPSEEAPAEDSTPKTLLAGAAR